MRQSFRRGHTFLSALTSCLSFLVPVASMQSTCFTTHELAGCDVFYYLKTGKCIPSLVCLSVDFLLLFSKDSHCEKIELCRRPVPSPNLCLLMVDYFLMHHTLG